MVLLVLLTLALAGGHARADGPRRAGLAVRFDDGRVHTACVAFSEDSLTGLQVLQRSGLAVRLGFGGGTVCRIEDVGCEGDNCFCQCTGVDCEYWAYFRLGPDGTWEYSQVGVADVVVRDGDVEGWSWGPGVQTPPPAISFADICGLRGTITPVPVPATARATSSPQAPASPASEVLPLTPRPASSPRTHDARQVAPQTSEVFGDFGSLGTGMPASYGVFALVVLGLAGVLIVLRPGRTSRR